MTQNKNSGKSDDKGKVNLHQVKVELQRCMVEAGKKPLEDLHRWEEQQLAQQNDQ